MISIEVDGKALDLTDVKLTQKETNRLLAFDNVTLQRSQSISVPRTVNNDIIFSLASNLKLSGDSVMSAYNALLKYSGGATKCILYVTSCETDAYKCLIVINDVTVLKTVQDSGSVRDLYQANKFELGSMTYTLQNDPQTDVEFGRHITASVMLHNSIVSLPSLDLVSLINDVASYYEITCNTSADDAGRFYIAVDKPHLIGVRECSTITHYVTSSGQPRLLTSLTSDLKISDIITRVNVKVAYRTRPNTTSAWTVTYKYIEALRFCQPVKLNFNGTGTLLCVQDIEDATELSFSEYGTNLTQFGVADVWPVTGIGNEVAEVVIPANHNVLIARGDSTDYIYTSDSTADRALRQGWLLDTSTTTTATITLEGDDNADDDDGLAPDSVIYYRDNVPDVSYVDLLRTYAVAIGKLLYVHDNIIDFVSSVGGTVYDIDDAIEYSSITRNAIEFSQHNYIDFEDVENTTKKIKDYALLNATLDAEQTLYTIPFASGYVDSLYYNSVHATTHDTEIDAYVIAEQSGTAMTQLSMPDNALIASMIANHTSVQVKCHMTLAQFNKITCITPIRFRGQYYVYYERQWSDDIAIFKLSRYSL